MKKTDPIAVFDSGLGGISVLRELKRILPNENYLYFGDSANAPYGERTRENIRELSKNVAEHLMEAGCKCIVIACNTATLASCEYLEETFPKMKFIGIRPAVAWAAETLDHPFTVTFATNFTIGSEGYKNSVKELEGRGTFLGIGAPQFVTLVESGVSDNHMTDECIAYIDSLIPEGIAPVDAVVLGCTHFPFLGKTIQKRVQEKTGGSAEIFDAAVLTARRTKEYLDAGNLLNDQTKEGTITFENSDPSKYEMMKKLYEC